jgi:hypothetical protein
MSGCPYFPFALDASVSYTVAYQIRGATVNSDRNLTGQLFQFTALTGFDGLNDPVKLFHKGNDSHYAGDDWGAVSQIANVLSADPCSVVQPGLDAHTDRFDPMNGVAGFLAHFAAEAIPFFFNRGGETGTLHCLVFGGCH